MEYQAGWGKQRINIRACGYAMHGFGQPGHRATGTRNPLYARAFYIREGRGAPLIYACLDLGYITHAMRAGVVARLQEVLGADFDEARLVLTCTHTHSGPGGCSHDGLYNLVTPGFVPAHVAAIVDACASAIEQARQGAAPTTIGLASAPLPDHQPVAWNRSLKAYNRNPDVQRRRETETHLALDRTMHVLSFRRAGKLQALLSLFGVHATCLGNQLSNYDGDNKGYAARHAEQSLAAEGVENPVAVFAQGTAGDVSPHYHGPGAHRRRRRLKGEAEYAYAQRNGQQQSEHALAMLATQQEQVISGALDGVLSYVDMSDQHAAPEFANGNDHAYTSAPCHGVAFFAGTPIDGPGMPAPLVFGARQLARKLRQKRLKNLRSLAPAQRADFQRLYDAQAPKDILMEAGSKQVLGYPLAEIPLPNLADPLVKELKQQAKRGALTDSDLVPSVLPIQIVRLGNLTLVCAPGEFTTVAGRRLLETVNETLGGKDAEPCLINTYCNDYMGYVTTFEEYQQQAYEGGHTVFGQWTLAAFQSCFVRLAKALAQAPQERDYDSATRPPAVPPNELALRSALPPR